MKSNSVMQAVATRVTHLLLVRLDGDVSAVAGKWEIRQLRVLSSAEAENRQITG